MKPVSSLYFHCLTALVCTGCCWVTVQSLQCDVCYKPTPFIQVRLTFCQTMIPFHSCSLWGGRNIVTGVDMCAHSITLLTVHVYMYTDEVTCKDKGKGKGKGPSFKAPEQIHRPGSIMRTICVTRNSIPSPHVLSRPSYMYQQTWPSHIATHVQPTGFVICVWVVW